MELATEHGVGTSLSPYSSGLVTALDLGASGINSKQLDQVASIWDHVQPLMEFMSSIPHDEKVILVGHSYGGLPISLAMERFPQNILVAVFVTAYLPNYTSPPGTLIQEVRKCMFFSGHSKFAILHSVVTINFIMLKTLRVQSDSNLRVNIR